jgi:hypothetical protein
VTSKILTVVDGEGRTYKVGPAELKAIDKKHRAKEGNPLEIVTQGDGATVGLKESNAQPGYVKARLSVAVEGVPAGTEVQVKALDYTSKADNEMVDVLLPNKKLASIKKVDVKLFEAGVYNSELDFKNNPKTKENKPDETTGKIDLVMTGIENSLIELQDLAKTIEEDTSLSSETIKTCIAELTNYRNSLAKEKEQSASATV